jgi:hypothetical protein
MMLVGKILYRRHVQRQIGEVGKALYRLTVSRYNSLYLLLRSQ